MQKAYKVVTGHADKWWWIEIPDVEMGFSQAKNFRQVESMAREVISLLLNVPEDSFTVEVRVEGAEGDIIKAVEELDAAASAAKQMAQAQRRKAVRSLTASGLPVRDVAEMLHVSASWVSELNKEFAA